MGAFIRATSLSPRLQRLSVQGTRHNAPSRAGAIAESFREPSVLIPSLSSDLGNAQTQLNQAANFGHHWGQMLHPLATPQPVQAKALEQPESPLATAFYPRMRGGGSPLPQPVQQKMEGAFGTSFADVRVHESPQAKAIGAAAYTQGTDIHFAPGQYDPSSLTGQTLLGHELTHVVQQRSGQVATPQGKGIPINADPALEAEADNLGARAALGESVRVDQGAGSGFLSGGLVSPSLVEPPVQCGLFKKIGKGIKGIGKGIGKGVKGLGKKFIDIAPSLYSFGLDVASAMPGPIGMIGNGVRSIAGLDNSLLSGLIKGEGIESAMEDSVGSFMGGLSIPGMPGMGGGGMPDLGGLMGGGMPALAGAGGPMLGGLDGMSGLGGFESLLGGLSGGSGNMNWLKNLMG